MTSKTILILAGNPINTARLRLDQEMHEIDNSLQRAGRRDEFVLKQVLTSKPIDVRQDMLDLKPNIVHFCGHNSGEEGIAFEDENERVKLVNADALANFFELFAGKVECIVLNACYSEVQAEAIANHISYVIGVKKAIGETAANEFAAAFYYALGAGESVEFAYKLACNAIWWPGMPENLTSILKSTLRTVKQAGQSEKLQNIRDASSSSDTASSSQKEVGLATIRFRVEIEALAIVPSTHLFIDGNHVSSTNSSQTADIDIRSGQHTIYAKRGFMTSNSLAFTIGQSETIEIACSMKFGFLVNKLILTQLRTYKP